MAHASLQARITVENGFYDSDFVRLPRNGPTVKPVRTLANERPANVAQRWPPTMQGSELWRLVCIETMQTRCPLPFGQCGYAHT